MSTFDFSLPTTWLTLYGVAAAGFLLSFVAQLATDRDKLERAARLRLSWMSRSGHSALVFAVMTFAALLWPVYLVSKWLRRKSGGGSRG